ncbi:AMP-binding protein [Halomonas sp. McH1-25]|uniref:AMP-binding protein n=1 Tax=unclassified Halomonas TaxID=2609666 RepID=UPI001EF4EAC3|nr:MULTISPECIES: AMP-binding protein [unclassified Halomonas]MCG7602149.1 AMP-binding protein [Halomonas sp. McH1-25]MCP1344220.1 AMP-binding protein [Halomonas sp. FL8]MCP1360793.1 AMP-binding protein [Halomonas sp. BBD45]MCP1365261.1 AMP-binding protein [Halomonas sp. BBD48]
MSQHATAPILSGPALEGLDDYASVMDVFHASVRRFADKPAFSCMGRTLSYAELDRLSSDFAAWLQHETDLEPGDRIAIQLPNLLQFPIAVFGALRAGLVIVNTNPLYTEREMQHQFTDSGAKAIVILANMADKLERVIARTEIRHVLVTQIGDIHGFPKRLLINAAVKYIKKMVPRYSLPEAADFRQALAKGHGLGHREIVRQQDDVAALQYTGGTTGLAKGTMLTHSNLVANMLQSRAVISDVLGEGCETVIAPLPVYHIYTFTVNCLFMMETGNHTILIPNPRDIDAFIKLLKTTKYTGFVGLNTLFNALCNREDFRGLDFSSLKLTISGGMALTKPVAKRWEEVTGCPVAEGYGMTETSPVVSFNPPRAIQLGTIGKPVPGTSVKVVDGDGEALPFGEAGELCVKGPQVMKGYWNRPDDTAVTLDTEGWIRTGDIAVLQDDGYIRIVDRKKDMIIVSGFNVYPNEIEDVVAGHPDVIEACAVGVPDETNGEVIKLFVVSRNEALDAETLRQWCRQQLTGYKVPKLIEFRDELPKTNVGKVLRRELRVS